MANFSLIIYFCRILNASLLSARLFKKWGAIARRVAARISGCPTFPCKNAESIPILDG